MERELEIIKDMPGVEAASYFSIKVITLHMSYIIGTANEVKVSVSDKHMSVEEAVASVLDKAGYQVLRGDNIQIASFILARKCMTYVSEINYFNDDVEKAEVKRLMSQSNSLLKDFLAGKSEKLLPLLENMEARWKIRPGNFAQTDKNNFIKIFVQFLSSNPAVAEDWIRCYDALPYDPRGVPDLFAWSTTTNRWFWIEVKSINDGLRPEQWAWMEHFQRYTGQNTHVVRIIPAKYQNPSPTISKYIAVNTTFHNGEPIFTSRPYQVSRILRELIKNSEEFVMAKYKLSREEIKAAKDYAAGNGGFEESKVDKFLNSLIEPTAE